MESKILAYAWIATTWLLSLCIVTQCAIHETNMRHEVRWHTAEQTFSNSQNPLTKDYNTPSKGFEGAFKGDL